MAFTYSDGLSTSRDQVRFYVGDTQENEGPRPDRRNFSDNEIAFALSEESSLVKGTVANLFEVLASEWTAYAIQEREGEVSMDAKETAENYRKQAETWRKKQRGVLAYESGAGSYQPERVDGYND